MRYLKKFNTSAEYNEFIKSGNVYKPNVSYCTDDDSTYYIPFNENPSTSIDMSKYDENGNPRIGRTTANCYIVKKNRDLLLPSCLWECLISWVR